MKPNSTPYHILLVDDEKVIRETLCSILQEDGYEVFTASSGKEAVEQAREHLFDLAILDIKLPDVGGLQVLKDIKKRIDEISSRYIVPSENTTDFALMYIPAEAIYYEIMFGLKEKNVGDYAWKNKVVLTSPNTIYLTLKTIIHWFKDTQISKQTSEILNRLNKINKEADDISINI